ncbi:rhomboid family intramembrane serine protease [Candidatus Poribacteria bacterium]|nr:rhomboid family intramembrane serine protease [Candidatus Poribacteria bacterium]
MTVYFPCGAAQLDRVGSSDMENRYGGDGFGLRRRRGMLPTAIKYLLIANVGLFAADWVATYLASRGVMSPVYWWLFDPRHGALPLQPNIDPDLAAAYGMLKPWQLVTYMFVHGGIGHVGINMFMLWMFGVEVEERWGTRHFTTYYFLCGIGGAVLQILVPMLLGKPPVPVVGASGAVAGALLAYGLMFPNRRLVLFPIFIPIPAKWFVVIYVAVELFRGLGGSTGIAHFAHLGGMLFGYLYIRHQQRKRRFLRF